MWYTVLCCYILLHYLCIKVEIWVVIVGQRGTNTALLIYFFQTNIGYNFTI